ncbi:nitroreductase family protein [Spirochaeta dissipatitropha]
MIENLRMRRSIRKYKETAISADQISLLQEAALRSPSSRSIEPCEFVFIDDRRIIKKLAEAKEHGSSFLSGAPLLVAVIANTKISDVWIEDASIAAWSIQSTAESLKLGACWVQIRQRSHNGTISSSDYVSEVLHLPDGIAVEALIGIGYPDEKKNARKKESLNFSKLHRNTYNS